MSFLSNYLSRMQMFNRNIRLLLLGDVFIGLGMTFWMLLFNLYLKEFGADLGMSLRETSMFIGKTTAIGQFAAALFAIPAGYLAGRMNNKLLLIAAHALSSFAFMGAIVSPEPISLHTLLFAGMGFGVFIWVVTGPFTMANTGPKERTYVFSFAFTLRLVGGIAGNIIAGHLKDLACGAGIAQILAYRYTILGGIFFSLLAVVPFFFIQTPKHRQGGMLSLKGWRRWDWVLFAKALLPTFLLAIGAGLIVQFMNLYLKDTFPGLLDSQIGFFLSMQSLTMVFGMLLAPALAERYGKIRTIVYTQLASIPFMLLLALTGNLWLAVAALVVRASLMNMSGPVSNTLVLELCRKEEQGVLSALFTMNWNFSWAVSAIIYGYMRGNYRLMFFIAIGLYISSTLLYYAFFKDAEDMIERRRIAQGQSVEVFESK